MHTFLAYGLCVGLEIAERRLRAEAVDRLPPGSVRTRRARVDRQYAITVMGRRLRATVDNTPLASGAPGHVLDRFEADVKLFVSEMAHDRVFVHAGAVAWRGQALVIPAHTLAGKSTLVAALVKAGARYYSDEYAVLDARGRLHPYARPLAMRTPGSARQTRHAVSAFGGREGRRPLRIALVLATQYEPGAKWRPQRLTAGEGALRLFAHTVAARSDSRRALTTVGRAAAGAVFLEGPRGDADETALRLLDALDRLADNPKEDFRV
jgi:hypothetical protein